MKTRGYPPPAAPSYPSPVRPLRAALLGILCLVLAAPLHAQQDSSGETDPAEAKPPREASGPQLVTEFVELYYLRDSYYACKLLRGDDCPDEPAAVSGHLETLKSLRAADAAAKIAEQDARLAAAEARKQEGLVLSLEGKVAAAADRKDQLRRRKADLEVEKKAQDRKVTELQEDPEADVSSELRKQDQLESDIALLGELETEAEAELQAVKTELEAAKTALAAAQAEEKSKTRDSALKTAEAETAAEELTDARVKALRRPLDVIAKPDSSEAAGFDPLMRVDVRTAGPARLRLTGSPEDVKLVGDLIRDQMDVPTAQARIVLWRLQVSGEKARKLEPVVRTIEESMSLAQGQTTVTFLALRDSLRETVKALQDSGQGPEAFYPDPIWEAIGLYYGEDGKQLYKYEWTDAWPFNPVSATTLAEATLIIILARESVRHQVLRGFCETVGDRITHLAHQSRERRKGKRISKVKPGYYPFTRVVSVFGGIGSAMSCTDEASRHQVVRSGSDHLTPDQVELLRIFSFFRYFQVVNQLEHLEKAQASLIENLAEPSLEQTLNQRLRELESEYDSLPEGDEKTSLEQRINTLQGRQNLLDEIQDEREKTIAEAYQDLNSTRREMEKELGPLALLDGETRGREVRRNRRNLRPRIAAANQMLKRYISAFEDDFENLLIRPALEEARKAARKRNVELGSVGRTSVLGVDRLPSRVDPKSSIEFDIPDPGVPIVKAIQIAKKLAGQAPGVYGLAAILAGKAPPLATQAGMGGADSALDGGRMTSNDTSSAAGGLESLVPDPAVYKVRTGVELVITPVVLPDGQSVMFELDYRDTSDVREPVRADERHLGRIERHHVFTQVQDDNLEIRELSRYDTQQKVARRSRGIPLLGGIPGLSLLFGGRVSGKDSLQQSLLFVSTVVYPSVDRLSGLFSSSPPRRSPEPADWRAGQPSGQDR